MEYEIKKFKDGQITAKIIKNGDLNIQIRGNSYEDLFTIASIKEAWDYENSLTKNKHATLTIYCLIGQRSDRRFENSTSFDLNVIAKFINSLNFDKVKILHPHSSVALALIKNSEEISHYKYVKKTYDQIGSPLLISPDAGAYKVTHTIAEKLSANLIPSNKIRVNGEPEIIIQGDVTNKECLIVDDIADGGRTFLILANKLKKMGAKKVFLYVTHAQFNYGFKDLKQAIDHIYCTNSYKNIEDDFITQFKIV